MGHCSRGTGVARAVHVSSTEGVEVPWGTVARPLLATSDKELSSLELSLPIRRDPGMANFYGRLGSIENPLGHSRGTPLAMSMGLFQ